MTIESTQQAGTHHELLASVVRLQPLPIIDPRYLSDSDGIDRAAMMEGLRVCAKIADAPPLKDRLGSMLRPLGATEICEASVMPTIIRGHTHAPCMVIGAKAAGLIADANFGRRCSTTGGSGSRIPFCLNETTRGGTSDNSTAGTDG
jgi:hypothetical protein